MCFVFRYENLMQINLESSEVDEISEINTKLLRVSILQSPCHSQNGVPRERMKKQPNKQRNSNIGFSMNNNSKFSKSFLDCQRQFKCLYLDVVFFLQRHQILLLVQCSENNWSSLKIQFHLLK